MKKYIIALALLASFGSADANAQNFLNKLGKAIEKEVGKEVEKKINQLKGEIDKHTQAKDQPQQQAQAEQPTNKKTKSIVPTETEAIVGTSPVSGEIGDHAWVDLGLPSGTLWASCNVDASKASQTGGLYAWGETATKSSYTQENSKHYKKTSDDFSGDKTYDVATSKWGKSWRTPTKRDFEELLNYCNWEYVQMDGRWCSKFTSTLNNEYIILPVSGYKDGSKLNDASGNGMYWTSTPRQDQWNTGAYMYQFGGALGEVSLGERSYGYAVRPVADNPAMANTPSQGETGGHAWVDLGLPSGTKWATCNLGAANAEQHGDFFAWGETTQIIDKDSAKNEMSGKQHGDITADSKYDAARAIWGQGWQMPTKADFQELMEHCDWEWTRLGRMTGCKVTSKLNGNYIFLPVAGSIASTSSYAFPDNLHKNTYYWASTPSTDQHFYNADAFLLAKNFIGPSTKRRNDGYPIRPVMK